MEPTDSREVDRDTRSRDRAALAAGLTAVASVVLAAIWWWLPQWYPYGPDDPVNAGLNHLIPATPAVGALAVAGIAGVLVALASRRPDVPDELVTAGCLLLTAFFAVVLGDAALISTLGYVMALSAPFALVVLLVLLLRRLGIPVGLSLLALAVVVVAGATLDPVQPFRDGVGRYVHGLGAALGDFGPRIAWSWAMAAMAASWAWLGLADRRVRRGSLDPSGRWPRALRRWGRLATIGAAVSSLPYGLVRLTWLTPWPLGGHNEFLIQRELGVWEQAHGALLGVAAVLGAVLTLGLISRWGTIFPRWVPGVAGRPVPVALAVVPGLAVAGAITMSAPGIIIPEVVNGSLTGLLTTLLFFPLPIWGPMLAVGVLAYWQRRRHETSVASAQPRPTAGPVLPSS